MRNWDYRYTWVRDASFTIGALAASGCGFEASAFFDFFATATAGSLASGQGLQIMYGIRGERFIPEHELLALDRPSRQPSGAHRQRRVGPDPARRVRRAARRRVHASRSSASTIDEEYGAFLADVADRAVLRWMDVDEGIWEVRGGAGHFLYSKVMNWVALDRAVQLAPDDRRVRRARARAGPIIVTRSAPRSSTRAGATPRARTRRPSDATTSTRRCSMMPIVGFLPADDPRMRATIDAIADRLTDEHGFVFRYLNDDGLPGGEGTFGICTFWLAECLALAGEVDRARVLFDRMAGCANDVGLLAEEVDPATGELLGNFPQAFTHIGLIHAALAIAEACTPRDALRGTG